MLCAARIASAVSMSRRCSRIGRYALIEPRVKPRWLHNFGELRVMLAR